MSSGEERTHNWLLANMGHTDMECESDPGVPKDLHSLSTSDETPVFIEGSLQSDDESLNSWELNRISPDPCLDDDSGPPSLETQPPDSAERLESSRNTSAWINSSGGNFTTDEVFDSGLNGVREQVMNNQIAHYIFPPMVEEGEASSSGVKTSLEAALPTVPLNSPVQLSSPVMSGDISDDEAFSGICGLRNLGNTCFMAAGIQCLVNTPPIAQYFFSHNPRDVEEGRFSLATPFSQLIHKIWSGKFTCVRPSEFKDAFGQYFKDFRDYRQHDCQEFVTLLLEALRKQMPLAGDEGFESLVGEAVEKRSISSGSGPPESHISAASTPPQSPGSAGSLRNDQRMEISEDIVGIDSGPPSPKSSVSSSSVDAHLISLRLRPIPEEVKNIYKAANYSADEISYSGTISCHDGESVTSDFSDSCEVGSNLISGGSSVAVRQYNSLSASYDICDYNVCDTLLADDTDNSDVLPERHCDTSSPNIPKTEGCSAPGGKLCNGKSNMSIVKIEDIIKESKTSNVNVLVKENPANNKLYFDSEKYAKSDARKLKKSVDNLSRSGVKRVKEVNLIVNKLDNSVIGPNSANCSKYYKTDDSLNKRIRLDEKNVQYEMAKSQINRNEIADDAQPDSEEGSDTSEHNKLATDSWRSLTADGKSAVVDIFYGQFKSSLVCSVCNHTSIRFDPFSTLSVPLPNANEIQITVTYVQPEGINPIKCLLTVCKVSNVEDMMIALLKILQIERNVDIVFAEVFDNHIARILEEVVKTKFLNFSRNIYAFDMVPAPMSADEDVEQESGAEENGTNNQLAGDTDVGSTSTPAITSNWKTCNICLEEICTSELKTHENCDDCILCDSCVQMSCGHHGGDIFPCPVCQVSLSPSQLMAVAQKDQKQGPKERPKARILRIAVVFRIDTESSDNNKREMQLCGHPFLLYLPSRIKSARLISLIRKRFKHCNDFQLLLVDGRGYNCSRCLFSSHCRGCDAVSTPIVVLQAGDSLCIRFTDISPQQKFAIDNVLEHHSLANLRQKKPLTLYDCLRQFSQSETLQDSESWFCPKCERKQEATKTISIWRYPPFLIVHLERFLFHGAIGTKVDDKVVFPLDGLDLSDFVSGSQSSLLYSLYGCVCHVGVADAGHYTAVVRSPLNGEWHCFNDSSTSRQRPGEEEFSTAYLLFYHQKGLKFDLNLPLSFSFDESATKSNLPTDESMSLEATSGEPIYAAAADLPVASCSPRPHCSPSNAQSYWREPETKLEENIAPDQMDCGSPAKSRSSLGRIR